MKSRPFILRCAAFFLILVFSQKSGAGLFIHNFLHTQKTSAGFPAKDDESSKGLSYTCTCIDDFLMPFDETAEVPCSQPVLTFITPVYIFKEDILFHKVIFSSLRGPPFMQL